MRNRTFADLDRVVALGGGHGLGRVMSSLSSLNRADQTCRRRHCLGRYAQLPEPVNYRAERRVGDV